jgi:hypothetical protein
MDARSATPCDTLTLFDANAHRGRWVILQQGNLFEVKQIGAGFLPPKKNRRGRPLPFSAASRRRLLFRLARIDWDAQREAKFVTLTYPDTHFGRRFDRRTIDKDLWHRDIEKYVGRPIASLWRTEWQLRKTGEHVGKPMPHVHLVLFESRFIPWQVVRERWMQAISVPKGEYVRTEIERAGRVRNVAGYAAKYLAMDTALSLVHASYLSSIDGRAWGLTRRSKIPYQPERVLEDVPPAVICELRRHAAMLYKPIADVAVGGFTLLRNDAAKLFAKYEAMV